MTKKDISKEMDSMSDREYKPRRAERAQQSTSANAPHPAERSRSGGSTQSRPAAGAARKGGSGNGGGPSNRTSGKKRKGGYSLAGAIITAVMLVLTIAFDVFLAQTKLLPAKYLVLLALVLFLLVVIIAMLVADHRKRGRFSAGVVLSVLVALLLIFATAAIAKGVGTLSSITGGNTETTHVGIYVQVDDPAQDLNDAAGYTFGIMTELDRENVDKTLDQLNQDLNTSVRTAEYAGLAELVDGLFNGETGAIILNDAYLEIISEMEGYEDVESRLRELTKIQVESEIKQPTSTQDSKPEHVFTMFISGIDSRNGLTAKSRSDVNILATVNTETHQVLLISTPRDYYVPLSISNGVPDKLTHAGIYGIDVCMDTIGMIYDIDVDYYFRVNFEGFEDIIDSLGGVDVYSDYAFTSSNGNHTFKVGMNHMTGEEALGFVRERYAFAEGDRQRGKNQIAVIKGVINKALSPEILTSFTSLMDAVEGSFETSMPYDEIAAIVRDQLNNGGDWNIVTYSVDGTGASKKPYSMSTNAYVMIPDETTVETAKDMIDQVCNDEIITES